MQRAGCIHPGMSLEEVLRLKQIMTAGYSDEVCTMGARLPAGRFLRLSTQDIVLERKFRRASTVLLR